MSSLFFLVWSLLIFSLLSSLRRPKWVTNIGATSEGVGELFGGELPGRG